MENTRRKKLSWNLKSNRLLQRIKPKLHACSSTLTTSELLHFRSFFFAWLPQFFFVFFINSPCKDLLFQRGPNIYFCSKTRPLSIFMLESRFYRESASAKRDLCGTSSGFIQKREISEKCTRVSKALKVKVSYLDQDDSCLACQPFYCYVIVTCELSCISRFLCRISHFLGRIPCNLFEIDLEFSRISHVPYKRP